MVFATQLWVECAEIWHMGLYKKEFSRLKNPKPSKTWLSVLTIFEIAHARFSINWVIIFLVINFFKHIPLRISSENPDDIPGKTIHIFGWLWWEFMQLSVGFYFLSIFDRQGIPMWVLVYLPTFLFIGGQCWYIVHTWSIWVIVLFVCVWKRDWIGKKRENKCYNIVPNVGPSQLLDIQCGSPSHKLLDYPI